MDIAHPSPIKLIKPTTGINNRLDTYELNDTELSECHNFIIDDRGYPVKRPGYWRVATGVFHSLPQEPDIPLVVQDRTANNDSALYVIASDHTVKGIRQGMTICAHMAYTRYKDRVYYMNGFDLGYVLGDTSYTWSKGVVDSEDLRILSGPPVGSHLAIYNGRMLIAKGKHLFFSELYNPHLFELHRNFVSFAEDIIMVRPVSDGIYISTTKSVYFISGEISDIVIGKLVSTNPAVEWTDISQLMEAQKYGISEPTLCAIWTGLDGVNWGLPGGRLIKVNDEKVAYPKEVTSGAGLLYGHSYIHSIT